MNPTSDTVVATQRRTTWASLPALAGPPLVGFIGGAAGTILVALALGHVDQLMGNAAGAYEAFPDGDASWLASYWRHPAELDVVLTLLGFAAWAGIGLCAVRLAGAREWSAAISTGLSTAAFAMLAAIVFGFGWAATMDRVVAQSLDDYTLLIAASWPEGVPPPTDTNGYPWATAQQLQATYPRLQDVAAAERPGLLYRKIVADQVTRGVAAPWEALLLAIVTLGSLVFAGALAGTFLLRRGDRLAAGLWPYLELTLPGWLILSAALVVVLKLFVSWALWDAMLLPRATASFWWLLPLSAVIYWAVVQRWEWFARFMLAASFGVLIAPNRVPLVLALLCHAGTVLVVARHIALRWRKPAAVSEAA